MSLKPIAKPVYTKKAIIVDVSAIKGLPLSVGEIAQHSATHQNTVSAKLNGSSGQYNTVHKVFTAANVASSNAFSRSEHVKYIEGESDPKTDPELDKCLVFHKCGQLISALNESPKSIGDKAGVATHVVKNISAGLPVCRTCVEAVFEVVSDLSSPKLKRSEHLFK